ncbi:serine protease easter-like [Contarinia nasturtii]|uniref:serine protease easter-like n=1 Tax=Contarinia nasturtii TaxID=265458 RepID=UPI0012D3E68B|nr:serine protease easter-like [Contarinia nasturtii]
MLNSVQLLLYFLILFLYYISLSSAQSLGQSCQTPDQKQGTCIDLHQCPSLFAIYTRRPLSTDDRSFLLRSQCGSRGHSPLLCCALAIQPTTPSPPRPENHQQSPNVRLADELLPPPGVCGLQYEERIIGGEETALKEFPWTVLLKYSTPKGEAFNCGGSLIHKDFVITACHCVDAKHLRDRRWTIPAVRLGEWDVTTNPDCEEVDDDENNDETIPRCSEPYVDIPVAEIIRHEQYRPKVRYETNDIALIRLQQSAVFTDFVRPICLPIAIANKKYDDLLLTAAGWGVTERGTTSHVKMKVAIKGVPLNQCIAQYGNLSIKQICAGEDDKDVCNGDSGGPLMIQHSVSPLHVYHYLTGIVSFGPVPCARKGSPAVYTRVDQYIDWILSKIS